ncbi:MAG: hypothetical protein II680_13215 [Clostridia bacterium]|nr:hypothetical protein [Clostridia bacterium]
MKRLIQLAVCLAVLLLPAACSRRTEETVYCCNRTEETVYCYNRPDGCQIGETIILDTYSVAPNVYTASLDKPTGLCRDPLCDHKGGDGICPEYAFFSAREFCTDGEVLYMLTDSPVTERGDNPYAKNIYAVDPHGNQPMRLICKTENTGNYGNGKGIATDGETLYYQNCHYRPGAEREARYSDGSEQYYEIMRIKKTGGKPEKVFDMLPVGTAFSLDRTNYYLIDIPTGTCTVVDRETGEESFISCEGLYIRSVLSAKEHTYFLCDEPTVTVFETVSESFTPAAVVEYKNGECRVIAEHIRHVFSDYSAVVCEGTLWYLPFELQYLYTVDAPTGRGSETRQHDMYATTDGTVCTVDLASGETRRMSINRWNSNDNFAFVGISEGVPIGRILTRDGEYKTVRITFAEITGNQVRRRAS